MGIVPREQRLRLGLGVLQLAIAALVLIVMLPEGSVWWGWLVAAGSGLSGAAQLFDFWRIRRRQSPSAADG